MHTVTEVRDEPEPERRSQAVREQEEEEQLPDYTVPEEVIKYMRKAEAAKKPGSQVIRIQSCGAGSGSGRIRNYLQDPELVLFSDPDPSSSNFWRLTNMA